MANRESVGDCFFSRINAGAVCALFVIVLGVVGVATCLVLRKQSWLPTKFHYGVVVDAGSSHTDLQLFRWPSNSKYKGTADLHEIGSSVCSKSGISSFKRNPSEAGSIILKCVHDIAGVAVGKKDQPKTTVYVGATAGMRLLCQMNETVCDMILEAVRSSLKQSLFRLKNDSVRVLTGKEEAVYGWISMNLLTKTFMDNVKVPKTYGTLDLGGASFEVAFEPSNGTVLPLPYSSDLHLYGNHYNIYSHSYLCYGINEAERKMIAKLVQDSGFKNTTTNPCYPAGYSVNLTSDYLWKAPCSVLPPDVKPFETPRNFTVIGSSSYEACETSFRFLFNTSSCKTPPCSFNGIYQPTIQGQFGAFSVISLMADLMNVSKNASLDIFNNASRQLCRKHWAEMLSANPKPDSGPYIPHFCFEAAYSYSLLVNGLHFPKNSNSIDFVSSIKGTKVSWALGLVANASNLIPNSKPVPRLSSEEFQAAIVGAVMFLIVGMVLFIYFVVLRPPTTTRKYRLINED